jgi:hypothetical protein
MGKRGGSAWGATAIFVLVLACAMVSMGPVRVGRTFLTNICCILSSHVSEQNHVLTWIGMLEEWNLRHKGRLPEKALTFHVVVEES